MCFRIIFIFAVAASTLTNGNKLDLSWSGLTKEKFFRDSNGSVTDRVEKATELNLQGNLFDNFLDCSAKLDKLEVLDLSRNRLKTFFFECKEQDNLYKLNVSHNKLTFLNDTALTKRITKLEVLDLSYNSIQIITQETFQHLLNLRFLALNSNPIGNNIGTGAFRKLRFLTDLNLGDISACKFPKDLFTPLINLRHLSLAMNPLEEVPTLPAGIETLDLSGTNIFQMQKLDFPNLKTLIINHMPRLESLDFNQLEKLRKLTVLSVENSPRLKKLTALPTRTDLLPDLKKVSIKNCAIDKLGLDLQSVMLKTSALDLQNNPWHCDCGMKWILSLKSTMNDHDHVRCKTPPELHEKRVFEIPANVFECEGIDYLALSFALGVFLIASCVAALGYFAREPIKKWGSKSTCGDTVSYRNMIGIPNDTEKIFDQSDITDYQ